MDALVVDIPRRDGPASCGWCCSSCCARARRSTTIWPRRSSGAIREDCSPRHVPNDIRQIAEVPRTLSGKVLEVPVKRILMGRRAREAASVDSLANPASLDYFVELAGTL